MNINKHPIYKAIYDMCLEIEKLPASDQQTKVVTMAGALEKSADQLMSTIKDLERQVDRLETALVKANV